MAELWQGSVFVLVCRYICATFWVMETVGAPLIYCVDDEENIRTTVSYSLEKAGYTVESFSNGTEAWEKFQKKMPDLE